LGLLPNLRAVFFTQKNLIGGTLVQVVEGLHSKHEALSSSTSTAHGGEKKSKEVFTIIQIVFTSLQIVETSIL
jgi:hypothetical protein